MPEHEPDLTERIQALQADLFGRDGYLPVLALLLAAALCGLLIGDSYLGSVATVATTASALLITVLRSTDRPKVRWGTLTFGAFIVLMAAISPLLIDEDHPGAGWLGASGYVVIVALSLPLVLTRALQHRRVTLNTLCATVSAYLLLGMLFAGVYRLYGVMDPPFFAQHPANVSTCTLTYPVPEGCPSSSQYTYFSFITLATVGYGDLTPGTDPARAFVTLEAIVGQVFVITALARVVSLLGEDRPSLAKTMESEASPPDD